MPEISIKRQEDCRALPDYSCRKGCFGDIQVRQVISHLRNSKEGTLAPTYDAMLELVNGWGDDGCPLVEQLRKTLASHYHEFSRRGQSDESST